LARPSFWLINVARGELVDEQAILDGLESGQLDGVALDVFAQEPPQNTELIGHPKVVVTPHLGASTEEAQREVAIEASEQVLAVLNGEPARNTVNAPFVAPEVHAVLAPFIPVATVVGKLLTNLAEGQFLGISISYEGEIAEHDTRSLQAAVLAGLMAPTTTGQVNLINAPVLAKQRGLRIIEQHNTAATEYTSIVSATIETSEGKMTMAGTSLRNEPHIVKIDDYWLDIVPTTPYMLFVDNQDQPGSIGAVGTVAGRHNINISFMEVGRASLRGRAMMVIGLDDPVPPEVMSEIQDLEQINNVRLVRLG
jgi:D-3-phosphoglycerate dehydrogenase